MIAETIVMNEAKVTINITRAALTPGHVISVALLERFRRSESGDRPNSRQPRKDDQVGKSIFPKSQIDFDTYRVKNGKLFCPWCHDF